MAVQYNNKDNTWGGIAVDIKDAITTSKKQLSTESLDLFSNFNNNGEEFVKVRDKILDRGKFDEWCDSVKIASTAEKDFLKTWNGSGDIAEAFQAHLKNSTNGLTLFQRASKAASSAAKSFVAALSSMAITWLIVFLKFQVAWQSRIISKGQFDLLIFYSLLVHIYIVLHTQLQLFFAFYHHFY